MDIPGPRKVYRLVRTVSGRPAGFSGKAVVAVALVCALVGGAVGGAMGVRLGRSLAVRATLPPASGAPAGSGGAATPGGVAGGAGIPATRVSVEFSSAISEAAARVGPAVVGIVSQQRTRRGYVNAGTGSGVVFDRERGLIVTNAHVVEGAQRLVVMAEGHEAEAQLVGMDKLTDLAVVRAPREVLPAQAEFGDSDRVRVGDLAIAIGNPLGLNFQRTVTAGIISGVNRSLPISTDEGDEYTLQVLQTDAAINPGNSGGALVNAAGQVIGINTAKVAREGVEGIGFAIPINFARPIVQQLVERGAVARPVLGIYTYESQWYQQIETGYTGPGLVVPRVVPGGPAERAGLRAGDVILSLDGKPVNNRSELTVALTPYRPGDRVTLRVRRFGPGGQAQDFDLTVTLAPRA